MHFLEYSGLTILNKKYCHRVPTYEIPKEKCSIIDMCLTNSPETVLDFLIERKPFGANSQTCHKALSVKISLKPKLVDPTPPPRRTKFARVKRNKVLYDVTNSIIQLGNCRTSADYPLLVNLFFIAKRKNLGLRFSNSKPPPLSPKMRRIQHRFSNAIDKMILDKTNFTTFLVDQLEKLLNSQHKIEKDRKFEV